ncbi:MAG: GAF domain-containing protein [Pseudomonadota bacterium]
MNELRDLQIEVLHKVRDIYGTAAASVTLIKRPEQRLHHLIVSEMSDKPDEFCTPLGPQTCCIQVVASQDVLVVENYSSPADKTYCPFMEAEHMETYVGAPLFLRGVCVGALETMGPEIRCWSKAEIDKFREFAGVLQSLLEDVMPHQSDGFRSRHLN